MARTSRAEALANEIRGLQGEMADYNTLMDKLNTDTEVTAVHSECANVSQCKSQSVSHPCVQYTKYDCNVMRGEG